MLTFRKLRYGKSLPPALAQLGQAGFITILDGRVIGFIKLRLMVKSHVDIERSMKRFYPEPLQHSEGTEMNDERRS